MSEHLCGCGCGEPVGRYPQTRSHLGHKKGDPMRFRHGHRGELAVQAITQIPALDVAWIAGLLEGEGSFQLSRRVVRRKTMPDKIVYQPTIRLAMTDGDVVERFAALAGGVAVYTVNYEGKNGKKPLPTTAIYNRRALALMDRIYPLMGERRRQQIDVVREGATTPRAAAA